MDSSTNSPNSSRSERTQRLIENTGAMPCVMLVFAVGVFLGCLVFRVFQKHLHLRSIRDGAYAVETGVPDIKVGVTRWTADDVRERILRGTTVAVTGWGIDCGPGPGPNSTESVCSGFPYVESAGVTVVAPPGKSKSNNPPVTSPARLSSTPRRAQSSSPELMVPAVPVVSKVPCLSWLTPVAVGHASPPTDPETSQSQSPTQSQPLNVLCECSQKRRMKKPVVFWFEIYEPVPAKR